MKFEIIKIMLFFIEAIFEVLNALIVYVLSNFLEIINAYKALSSLKPINFICNAFGINFIVVQAVILLIKNLLFNTDKINSKKFSCRKKSMFVEACRRNKKS